MHLFVLAQASTGISAPGVGAERPCLSSMHCHSLWRVALARMLWTRLRKVCDMSWKEVSARFDDFGLGVFSPYVLQEKHIKDSLVAYAPLIAQGFPNRLDIHQYTYDTTGNAIVTGNNVLVGLNATASLAKMGMTVASAFCTGKILSSAMQVSGFISVYVAPPLSLINAVVESTRSIQASSRALNITRSIRKSGWPCTCRGLGALSINPASGELRGVRFHNLGLDSRSSAHCAALANYCISQLDKRSERARTAASVIAPLETIRSFGRSLQKRASGTKGVQRRYAAINLWSAARRAETRGECRAGLWSGNSFTLRINNTAFSLSAGKPFIQRLIPVSGWADVQENGCPMALATIHTLLGGTTDSVNASQWKKTLSVVGAFDGWRVIETAMRAV